MHFKPRFHFYVDCVDTNSEIVLITLLLTILICIFLSILSSLGVVCNVDVGCLCSPESVIERFQRSDITVDSRGVVEYLRALVVTNAIADYLPDEQSGKPSGLPTLVIIICCIRDYYLV